MDDLFEGGGTSESYSARDIEVLEGLEPVRRRPAMYVGDTGEGGIHHLFAEILDNAMDEAVAGHAGRIDIHLARDGSCTVADNGRGIPTDPHPKNPRLSALEVILTTLHAGGKFSGKAYATSGGLHGVGLSVVNALSESLTVEVARARRLWRQAFARGQPATPLQDGGRVANRRGTSIVFRPDAAIFGDAALRPAHLFRMARAKAWLHSGVEIRWSCAAALAAGDDTPAEAVLRFPGGLGDALAEILGGRPCATPRPFLGSAPLASDAGRVEWAVAWPLDGEGAATSYCNTVPTPAGGTHENGFRQALTRAMRDFAARAGAKKADRLQADDVAGGAAMLLSVFLREPQFQGQTKEKLVGADAARLVEQAVRDHADHFLAGDAEGAGELLRLATWRLEERRRRKAEKEVRRKAPARRLRLPGKLADCTHSGAEDTELFLVEGDSAGGSAKQARNRETQAVLPLRGKILNVASASDDKKRANQELQDLLQALGCAAGEGYAEDDLRYDKVIVMTDADVDGAHIASLLMTYFYRELPQLVLGGHLFLAVPPLYRIAAGAKGIAYARDDRHKQALLTGRFAGAKVEISRFKGLGEMPVAQLKATTMDPKSRTLLKVEIADDDKARTLARVESLMGRRPELRFRFIREHAGEARDLDL